MKYMPLSICDSLSALEEYELYRDDRYTNLLNELLIDDKKYLDVFNENYSDREFSKAFKDNINKSVSHQRKRGLKQDDAFLKVYHNYWTASTIKSWSTSKQVFTFDKDFYYMLQETPLEKIDVSVLKSLPFHTFYIDMENLELGNNGKDISGVFVHLLENSSYYMLFVLVCTSDLCISPHRWMLLKNMDFLDVDNRQIRQRFFCGIINAILYLCAENKIVEENLETKRTYRKSNIVRNKYSEIRKWDVAVRVGNVIRSYQKESTNESVKAGSENRHSPRPHMRKGHWHRYRVGVGKKEIAIKWISPILVNGNKDSFIPVVIHKEGESS